MTSYFVQLAALKEAIKVCSSISSSMVRFSLTSTIAEVQLVSVQKIDGPMKIVVFLHRFHWSFMSNPPEGFFGEHTTWLQYIQWFDEVKAQSFSHFELPLIKAVFFFSYILTQNNCNCWPIPNWSDYWALINVNSSFHSLFVSNGSDSSVSSSLFLSIMPST